jgi:hypothetical protein
MQKDNGFFDSMRYSSAKDIALSLMQFQVLKSRVSEALSIYSPTCVEFFSTSG